MRGSRQFGVPFHVLLNFVKDGLELLFEALTQILEQEMTSCQRAQRAQPTPRRPMRSSQVAGVTCVLEVSAEQQVPLP